METDVATHLEPLLERLLQESYFYREDKPYFRQNSRVTSSGALDTRVALSQAQFLHPVAAVMRRILDDYKVSQIVGKGYGSFFLVGGILASADHFTGGLLRESRKSYGFRQLVEGSLDKTRPLFIVDDVLSTGYATSQAVNQLRREGFRPVGLLTVFRYAWRDGEGAVRNLGLDCVSLASLHRPGPKAGATEQNTQQSSFRNRELNSMNLNSMKKELPMKLRVIRTWHEAKAHSAHEPALIEVPGKWVPGLASVVDIADRHRHEGLLVTNVGPDSLAARAGIERGDVLLRYDGIELDKVLTLRRLIRSHSGTGKHGHAIIEAARGPKKLRLEVPRGPLGITASALFRRLSPAQH